MLKEKLVAYVLGLLVAASAAGDYGSVVITEITSIYDADTFRANIADWPAVVGERVPIRVKGIDAPELRGKCPAETAKARQAKQVAVEALRGGQVIELRAIERDKYFRLLADVYIDGENLADLLLAGGWAAPYSGGTKSSWCPE